MTPISLPISELKPALLGLGKIINKSATQPVLSTVKIERTTEGWIALTTTDQDSFATVRLEQPDHGEPATVLVPIIELATLAKTCGKLDKINVSSLPDDRVALEYPIGTQQSVMRCDSIAVSEFPLIPRINGDSIAVPENVRTAFQEAWECASEDTARKIINSAYLDVSDGKCHSIVGTDGRHLYSSNSFHLPVKSSVIIPSHRFLSWKEFNTDGEWRMKVQDTALVQISTRRWRFITKQREGHYPNWRQVVPKNGKTMVEIEACDSVIQTINRLPDHDSQDHKIGIAVEHGVLLLVGRASDDVVTVPIPDAKVTGPDVRVHLNREFLLKALSFGLNSFTMEDALSALRFVNGGRQMIVMPIRGEWESTPVNTAPVESPVAGEEQQPAASAAQPEPKPMVPAKTEPAVSVNINNSQFSGDIAQNITKFITSTAPKVTHPPGSLGADLQKKGYIDYLVARYYDFKKSDKSFGKAGKFSHAELHRTILREFGHKTFFMPVEHFPRLEQFLKARVDRTILGQKNTSKGIRNYHSLEEHIQKYSCAPE